MNYYKNHKKVKRKFQTGGATANVTSITGSTSVSPLIYGEKPVGGPDASTRLAYMHPETRRMKIAEIQRKIAQGQEVPADDMGLFEAYQAENSQTGKYNPGDVFSNTKEEIEKLWPSRGAIQDSIPGGIKDSINTINIQKPIDSISGLPGVTPTVPGQKIDPITGQVIPGTAVVTPPANTEVVKPPTKEVTNDQLLDALDGKLEKAKDGEGIEELQRQLKVNDDGIWGPVSQAAFNKARRGIYLNTDEGRVTDGKIRSIQRRLGVKVDGIWGKNTKAAYDKLKLLQDDLGVKSDGIWGKNTKKAALDRSNKQHDEIIGLAKSAKPQEPNDGILTKTRMNTMTNGEARKKARGVRKDERKAKRAERKASRTEVKRRGGLFYNTVEK